MHSIAAGIYPFDIFLALYIFSMRSEPKFIHMFILINMRLAIRQKAAWRRCAIGCIYEFYYAYLSGNSWCLNVFTSTKVNQTLS
jgi:hypothetical protein